MKSGFTLAFVVMGSLLVGCAAQSASKGSACSRSAQCDEGLVCVKQVCTDDLSSVAKQSTVPDLMPDTTTPVDGADGG